uniref:DC1 domain-containing protein n=1 Tax=Noccaea caerulescens TaxID=107243 RepID=A0A1J3DRP3_NOCCA
MDHVYACHPCNYMVHETCIYIPRIIRITRHPHRLSFTPSLSPGDFSCGVCRKTVDINYGQYFCTKGCHYAIHSKCATREDVWDGIDLEGVPEESIEDEDIKPFVKIDEDTIKHFSHDHHMKLHNNGTIGDHESMFCDACILPIVPLDCFFSCMQCKFVLHEAWACFPRKKYHPLHNHPLVLLPSPSEFYVFPPDFCVEGMFKCKGCDQLGCGFVYECTNEDCVFELDVRCASITDPLVHECHRRDHPLFINMTKGECMRCKSIYNSSFFPRMC